MLVQPSLDMVRRNTTVRIDPLTEHAQSCDVRSTWKIAIIRHVSFSWTGYMKRRV